MFKNVASQKFRVFAFDATTGLPKSGDAANITAYISKDFGAVTVLGDTSATEEDSTNAKGYYLFDATQAETNADDIGVTAKSSTANIVVVGAPARITTLPPNFGATSINSSGQLDVIKVNGTSQTARDLGASVLLASGTGTGQISLVSGAVLLQATQTGVTIPTVTTVTNQLTAAQVATGVWTDATSSDFLTASSAGLQLMALANGPTTTQIAAAVWQDTTAGHFTTALSVGKSLMNGVSLGTGLTIAAVSGAVGSVTGAVGSVTGSVGSVTGAVGSVTGNVGGVTGVTFPATVASPTNITAATGVALSATGLDAIAVTDPGAPANHTTLAKMIVAVWRALWKKDTLTTTQWKRYANDGTTVNATSTVSDDGTTQTRGTFS